MSERLPAAGPSARHEGRTAGVLLGALLCAYVDVDAIVPGGTADLVGDGDLALGVRLRPLRVGGRLVFRGRPDHHQRRYMGDPDGHRGIATGVGRGDTGRAGPRL